MSNINQTNKQPLDPFAVDFFSVKKSLNDEEISADAKPKNARQHANTGKYSVWYKTLPHIAIVEAEFSNRIKSLPVGFTRKTVSKIGETIARYTFREPDEVKFSIISVSEINMAEVAAQLPESSQMFLRIGCEPSRSTALISFDTNFAASVIGLILGVKAYESTVSRRLSPVENTIIEFLSLQILSEINAWLGEEILYLSGVEEDQPAMSNGRGLETIIHVQLDSFSGNIHLYSPWNFLTGLDKTENPLYGANPAHERIRILENLGTRLNFRIPVGRTSLDTENLSFLEAGDIILIEQPEVSLKNGVFSGSLPVFLGSGSNFRLNGEIIPYENSGQFSDELKFRIHERSSREPLRQEFFRVGNIKMEEKEMENMEQEETPLLPEIRSLTEDMTPEHEENLAALENVQITLRVEMAGHKISLRELQNLRTGQIVALGCRPTDPVRLIADTNDHPIAIGELVDVEGELGLRLTKVFI